MTNKKNTRRALLASLMALLLCFSSLMGTTYAWFTDSVTSANNVITSGNLDITLDYWNGSDWEDVEGSSEIFDENALWEPGYTKVVYLKLENVGSLALKYQLGVNVVSETEGKTATGESIKLSDYIYMDVIENKQPDASFTREAALAAATTPELISAGYNLHGTLEADADPVYLALVVYMPSTVDNDANHDGVNIPKIELGVNVLATQLASESDSYDKTYDEDAAVDTVAKANALMAQGKDTYLIGANEPNSVLVIPADYTGTLTLGNVTVKAITAEKDANIVILGNVVVDANGSAISMLAASTTPDPISAITAAGTLTIKGSGNLTAIAKKDGNFAYGIGGETTTAITIEDVTINYVSGGHIYGVGSDTKHYKDAPTGGAAIGSGANGAKITLKNVIIGKAIGGSKAAGIGARYWTGVTISIDNCAIGYVEGGVSAAAIGGSRVSEGATESGTTININNSKITAQGGAYGAGIGSGYDTHCGDTQPLCTINITDSTINATGGKYAAGVGTGYHNAALAGEIKNSTVNAKSGEKFYKDSYSLAMDIGFGITDPTREGVQTTSSLKVNDQVITLADAPYQIAEGTTLEDAFKAGKTSVVLPTGNYSLPGTANKDVTINGTKDTVVSINKPAYHGSDVTFNGVTIQASGAHTGVQHVKTVTYNDATIKGEMCLYGDKVVFNNCTFELNNQYIWTYGAAEVEFNNCTFNTTGKAILIYKDGGIITTKVTVKGCTFNATAPAYAGAITNQSCAAIEIQNYMSSITLITEDNTVDADFSGEWRIKQYDTANNCTVTVNGTAYTQTALDGKLLTVVNKEVQ